jgi:hypothetical protein
MIAKSPRRTLLVALILVSFALLSTAASMPKGDTLVQCSTKTPCAQFKNTGRGSAIDAQSVQGAAIHALSRQGTAITGTTFGAALNAFYATTGVLGVDKSVNGLPNDGVQGVTDAAGDTGVEGDFAAYGDTGIFGVGVLGIDQSGPGLNRNVIGVLGESEGTGVFALSLATPAPLGQQQTPALNAACAGGGLAMLASDGHISPSGDLMSVDCAGNMILKGSLMVNGTPLLLTHTIAGHDVATYPSRQSQPTVEDVGQAQLVNGSAYVRIDPAFAATMSPSHPYLVFLTPDGPSRGLYVAGKTSVGFAVRENPGGHANLTFDFRIVASPVGQDARRLPDAGQVEMGFYRQALSAPHSTQSAERWIKLMRTRTNPL